ncbi:MAG: sugar transferase [Megasphaera sp.]|uniref:sugar transferase n=1 Tax=Megasphaera sp. TaxID=2023260 RepID=UPI003F0CF5BA
MKTRVYPTSRKLFGLLGDVTIITLTYLVLTYLLVNPTAVEEHEVLYSGMLPIAVIFTVMMFSINGLYTIEHKRFSEVLLSLAVSLFLVLLLIMALSFVIHEFSYSRVLVVASTGLQFVFLGIWKRFVQRWEQSLHPVRQVMIMGNEDECRHVYYRMSSQPQLNLQLQHVVMDPSKDWRQELEAYDIDIVIICSDIPIAVKSDIVNYCTDKEIQPYIIPSSYEIFCNGAMLQKIDDVPVFRPKSLRLSVEQRAVKRTVDIIISAIAAVCALPFAIPVAIAIKLEDGGPVLYSQVRVGRFGKEYKVYKFRSMRTDAEKYSGPQLATDNDPRITKVGKFIRATRLDELPQILNVLNGDMSLVGPRPERPYFVEQFKQENPEYAYRHNVKPGITGLAQVFAKYNTTPYDKLVYDLMYIENYSILEDFVIMIQTVKILVTKSATEGKDVSGKDLDLSKFER